MMKILFNSIWFVSAITSIGIGSVMGVNRIGCSVTSDGSSLSSTLSFYLISALFCVLLIIIGYYSGKYYDGGWYQQRNGPK